MTFPDDLVAQLVAEGVGTPAVDIFVSNKAALPRTTTHLVIVETGGTGSFRTQGTAGDAYENPSAQVLARGANYAEVRRLLARAYDALVKVRNQDLNGTWYVEIRGLQKFIDIGLDENANVRIAFNVLGTKRP
jgi:hypothetical protein